MILGRDVWPQCSFEERFCGQTGYYRKAATGEGGDRIWPASGHRRRFDLEGPKSPDGGASPCRFLLDQVITSGPSRPVRW